MEIVGQEQFEQQVVQASQRGPVVVDFWASWCGPCRVLGPVLERVVASAPGMTLVKVNVEAPENEPLAQRFGISSIPAVKVFHRGKQVQEFVGALPEAQIRRQLEAVLPNEHDATLERARAQRAAGQAVLAEQLLRQVVSAAPRHAGALLELGRLLVDAQRLEEARDALGRVPADKGQEHDAAQALLAHLDIQAEHGANAESALEQRVAKDPADLAARMQLGHLRAAQGDYPGALEHYLAVLARNKRFEDEAPRKAMLRVFSLVGPRAPLAEQYRTKMSRILYS